MTTFEKSTTYNGVVTRNVSYRPLTHSSYTSGDNSGQVFSIYYPQGPRPPGGWPWMLYTICNSFQVSQPDYATGINKSISPLTATTGGIGGASLAGGGVLYQCLLNNIAIVAMQCTGANAANPNGTVPNGNGLIHVPGGTSGLYEGRTNPSAIRDVVYCSQWVLHNSGAYGLDRNAWGVLGSSGGANALAWIGMAPDRSYELGTYGPFQQPTVPNVCVFLNSVVQSWPYMADAINPGLFPDAENSTTAAGQLSLSPLRYRREGSVSWYLSSFGQACTPPTYYWSATQGQSAIFGTPYQTNIDSAPHTVWAGLAMKHACAPGSVYLCCATGAKTAAVGGADLSAFFDRTDVADPDADGAADSAGSITGQTPIGHILRNIYTERWDQRIPAGGIRRRWQVNNVGRYCVPPSRGNRSGVSITNAGDDRHSSLLVGSDATTAIKILGVGDTFETRDDGPVWLKAYGGAQAIARYTSSEMPL